MLAHCLGKPGAWPDDPWGHEHPVVKVGPRERGGLPRSPRPEGWDGVG